MLGSSCACYECNTTEQGNIAANKAKCFFLPICCRSDVAEQNNLVEKLLVVHKKKPWHIQTTRSFGSLLGSRLFLLGKATMAAGSGWAAGAVGPGVLVDPSPMCSHSGDVCHQKESLKTLNVITCQLVHRKH